MSVKESLVWENVLVHKNLDVGEGVTSSQRPQCG